MSDALSEKGRKLLRLVGEMDVYAVSLLETLLLLLRDWSPTERQVFILGLPRSGTTLIYQYVVHRLRVAYFTNGVGRYYRAPCLSTWVQHLRTETYESDFESHYGLVAGPNAPHEAGRFWGRFFGFDAYVTADALSLWDRLILQRTVGCIQSIYGGAVFVNKNVKHVLRIPALHAVFPDALFLRVQRAPNDVALSLLRARYENLEDPRNWWSAPPPNGPDLSRHPPAEQVAHQVVGLSRKLDQDLSDLPDNRTLTVDYEEFCESPDNLIHRLQRACSGLQLQNTASEGFSASSNAPQTPEERELIRRVQTLLAQS